MTELSSCIEAFEINLEPCTSQILKRVFINFVNLMSLKCLVNYERISNEKYCLTFDLRLPKNFPLNEAKIIHFSCISFLLE